MKATVDKELCIGCELCTQTSPEVFKMVDGTAAAYGNPIEPENADKAKQAADECPVNCISIE